jgi:prepilin-type N-terminal cleavage/methylation domain-containing protein/prepilin-type processing-associated H-X9-DG protein
MVPGRCHVAECFLPQKSNSQPQAAFTLIELLVVVGIIGILAGLLLPALSQARERARSSRCISNLRQINLAMTLYGDDYGYYPAGHQAGVTQWDLCVGVYAGGVNDPYVTQARTMLFTCPSVKAVDNGTQLNYSANPNICKEVPAGSQVRYGSVNRASEIILIADAIQYTSDGSSHAILWGVNGSSGSPIYLDNGNPSYADQPVPTGPDQDQALGSTDPNGSNFRYRHSNRSINALFVDGHADSFVKGQIRDRNVYVNY